MTKANFLAYYHGLEDKAKARNREKLEKLEKMADPYLKWQSEVSIDC